MSGFSAAAAAEHDARFVAAMAHDGNHGNPFLECELDETFVAREHDAIAFGPGSRDVFEAARVDQHGRASIQCGGAVLLIGGHLSEAAEELAGARYGKDQIEAQEDQWVVEAVLAIPGGHEGRGVGIAVGTRMIPDQ